MDISTLVFLGGMTAVTGYVSYIIFCDVYALVTSSIDDLFSHSLLVKIESFCGQ